jgi:hypothetical protein
MKDAPNQDRRQLTWLSTDFNVAYLEDTLLPLESEQDESPCSPISPESEVDNIICVIWAEDGQIALFFLLSSVVEGKCAKDVLHSASNNTIRWLYLSIAN